MSVLVQLYAFPLLTLLARRTLGSKTANLGMTALHTPNGPVCSRGASIIARFDQRDSTTWLGQVT